MAKTKLAKKIDELIEETFDILGSGDGMWLTDWHTRSFKEDVADKLHPDERMPFFRAYMGVLNSGDSQPLEGEIEMVANALGLKGQFKYVWQFEDGTSVDAPAPASESDEED